jgi:hypothetical protein
MSAEDRLILLDCINTAIFNWYAAAPEHMRMTTVAHTLGAPESGTVTIQAGENTLPGLTLQDYHLGASIRISGETNMNEIISVEGTPTVLLQHTVSGTVGYTIYFDTIMITDFYVSRLVSHPRILETGVELYRDEDGMRFVGAERRGTFLNSRSNSFIVGLNFGEPFRYIVENTGISTGDEARFMIRVDPIPERSLTVTFDAVIDAAPIQIHQINTRKKLPVPEQYVLPHILPLAMGELAMTPIWDGGNTSQILQKAASIPSQIRSQIPSNRAAPKNYVRTKPGY